MDQNEVHNFINNVYYTQYNIISGNVAKPSLYFNQYRNYILLISEPYIITLDMFPMISLSIIQIVV